MTTREPRSIGALLAFGVVFAGCYASIDLGLARTDGGADTVGAGARHDAETRDAAADLPTVRGVFDLDDPARDTADGACDAGAAPCRPACAPLAAGPWQCRGPDGVTDEIAAQPDGLRSVVDPPTRLHESSWRRGATGMILHDERMWFVEGTTSCGGWGVRTVSFRPEADGTAGGVVARCESGRNAVATSLALGPRGFGLCYQTHAPDLTLVCGRYDSGPGTWNEVTNFGRPQHLGLVGSEVGFAGVRQHHDFAPAVLVRFDAAMSPTREEVFATEAGARFTVLARATDRWWVSRTSSEAPFETTLERLADDGSRLPTVRMPALGGASPAGPLGLRMVASGAGVAFIAAVERDIYLGWIDAEGAVRARRIHHGVGNLDAQFAPLRGGWIVAVTDTSTGVHVLRLDCAGRSLEPPIAVAPAPVSVWGAALDCTGSGFWLVTTEAVRDELFLYRVLRVRLP